MGPPLTIARRMRIARLVSVLMVHAMHGDPVSWTALQRHGPTDCHGILQPFRRGETAMRELTMIADRNPHVLTEQPHHEKYGDRRPTEEKHRREGPQVKRRDHNKKYPVEIIRLCLYHCVFGCVSFLWCCCNSRHACLPLVSRLT